MFQSLASLVTRRGWLIVLGWVAVTAALFAFAPPWSSVSRDDDVRQFPEGYPSVNGQNLLERGFPEDVSSSSVVFIVERPNGPLGSTDFAYAVRIADRMIELSRREPSLGIRRVSDHRTPVIGSRLVSPVKPGGGQAVLVGIDLNGTYVSRQARLAVDRLLVELESMKPPEGISVGLTGSAAVGHDSNTAANKSIHATTGATIALVVVILLVVYRSPLLALIPLATIGLSVWASFMAIASLTKIPGLNFQVINVTNVFVVVVLFGAGTDYCLFLIARYREELAMGRNRVDALTESIRQVGGALVASAGTVIVGLGMLWFSTFAKIRYSGPAIALSLAIALMASLTLAPVFLYWLRGAVFWPFKPPHHTEGADREQEGLDQTPNARLWGRLADWIVERPGTILATSLILLIPFAIFGARTRPSYDLLADLDADQPSVRGSRTFKHYWSEGELGPTTVLVRRPELDFLTDAGRKDVAQLTATLEKLPDVAEVRSLTQPLGPGRDPIPPKPKPPTGFLNRLAARAQEAAWNIQVRAIRSGIDAKYVSINPSKPEDRNHITRLTVVFKTNPFSEESIESLERIRGILANRYSGGVIEGRKASSNIGFAGTTIMIGDLKRVTIADEHRMYVLVTLGVYTILVVLLRKPGISLYLIATVILGYLSSLGMTELVFRSLHSGPDPWVGLDWKVGFFLFVILVAVGEDYNIFLMARVIEEEGKHGPIEGTRLAVAHTGGIISSCGLIMAGTFLSMLVGSLSAMRQLGFALGLGVLLDTFVVRPVLVPAFVILWHRTFPRYDLGGGALVSHEIRLAPEWLHANGNGHHGVPTSQIDGPVVVSKRNHPRPPRPW